MGKGFALALVLIVFVASFLSIVWPVGAVEDFWVPLAPMPQGGAVYGAATVDGQIYAFGAYYYGADWGSFTTYYTSGKYDPTTNTWSTISPMPTPRIEFATAVYENKIYVIGGKRSQVGASLNTVEVYDPATDNWTSGTPMPTARDSMQANLANGMIYVVGGQVSLIEPAGVVFSDANEVYDPKTNTWASMAHVPNPAPGISSVGLDDKIYLIGGGKPSIGPVGALNTIQIYDTVADKWTLGAPLPKAVGSASACATTGSIAPKRIYVFGGFGDGGSPSSFNQVYDPITDEWSMGAEQIFFWEVAVTTINDLIFVFGGSFKAWQRDQPANLWDPPSYNPPPPFLGINYQYTPIGYGTTGSTAPRIAVLSPENKSYPSDSVSVIFTIDEPATWMGYRLDGQQITAIDGNITLSGLASGSHNITIYARDTSGNIGASDTIVFTVTSRQELFPSITIAAISIVTVAVGAGLLVYFKKRKR